MSIFFLLRRLICWFRGTSVPLRTLVVKEMPDEPNERIVYIYRSGGAAWGLGFLCPCGCEEVIELNLITQTRPCWKIQTKWDTTPTIHPSVWRKVGCRSHFWIRDGII